MKNKRGEIGCLFIVLVIAIIIICLTTNVLNNIVGDEVAPWCKLGIFLVLAFLYGYHSAAWGKGPKAHREPSIASGFFAVGVVITFLLVGFVFNLLGGSQSNKTIIEKGLYASDKSLEEEVVYYVSDGDRYHKKSSCPSLHDSDYIYKVYITDAPEGRTPCGICY